MASVSNYLVYANQALFIGACDKNEFQTRCYPEVSNHILCDWNLRLHVG